jgi:hypothetical protein
MKRLWEEEDNMTRLYNIEKGLRSMIFTVRQLFQRELHREERRQTWQ